MSNQIKTVYDSTTNLHISKGKQAEIANIKNDIFLTSKILFSEKFNLEEAKSKILENSENNPDYYSTIQFLKLTHIANIIPTSELDEQQAKMNLIMQIAYFEGKLLKKEQE